MRGGGGIVKCTMSRSCGGPEVGRQSIELEVANLIATKPAGQLQGVCPRVGEFGIAELLRSGVQERDVEANVVPDDDGASEKFEEGGKGFVDRWGLDNHRLGDPGHDRYERRDRCSGVDQRLEGAQLLTPFEEQGADFGDPAVGRGAAGGFQVEHAEGDF